MPARLIYGLLSALHIAVIAVGLWLTPAARGFGTHQQLGLPACRFQKITGMVCPSCGLTTSFTLAAHGRIADSLRLQPFGTFVFLGALLGAAGTIFLTVRPRPIGMVFHPDRAMPVFCTAGVLYLAAWVYRATTSPF